MAAPRSPVDRDRARKAAKPEGKTAQLEAAEGGSVAGSQAAAGVEESLWLCPIEDRRGLDSTREGMMQGFSLGSYVKLVDYTGRLFRQGKATISAELAGIFERLGWMPRAGRAGWRSSAEIGCWAVSLQPAARSLGNRRTPRCAAPGQPDGLPDSMTQL